MMDKYSSAKRVVLKPQETIYVKLNPRFIPIHQYPFGYEFDHGEIGLVGKIEGEAITEIEKRIIVRA